MEYSKLVEIYEKIEGTSKRLEKTHYISALLKKTDDDDIEIIMLLISGKLFPDWDETKIGMSDKLILKAINKATGADFKKIEDEWKRTGDLGLVSENLTGKKSQSTLFSGKLSVKKVFDNIRKLALLSGEGTVEKKVSLVAELLTSASPLEAKYIVRTVLEELRVGIGEGSLRDAIVWAYFDEELGLKYDKETNDITLDDKKREKYNEAVSIAQRAYDITNEFSTVAKTAKKTGLIGLLDMKLLPGKPIKVMLSQKVASVEEGFETVGTPSQIEFKYDGFRMQIHKVNGEIKIFTRRLENVTRQFPDVALAVQKHVRGDEFLIDGEAVGFDPLTGKYLPFQSISQRIRRKYDIEEVARNFPIELNLFDIIYYNGEDYSKISLDKRRMLLEKIVQPVKLKIVIAKVAYTSNVEEARSFYEDSLKAGNEGIIMKRHDSFYKPGSRVGGWVKIKPVMESLDLVIVGAEWGEGKRSGWLTSFTVALINEYGDTLEVGKVGTGIKELESEEGIEGVTFDELTKLLKPLVINESGKEVKVKPKVVIEVKFEEIQKSPTYSSGYALRFPRLVRLRNDRGPDDASTLDLVEEFYLAQRGRGN
jgi:DNA ligase 1